MCIKIYKNHFVTGFRTLWHRLLCHALVLPVLYVTVYF